MNYPYPVPGSSTAGTAVANNYFYVGNECCCAGSLTKSTIASILVYLDYSQAMATAHNSDPGTTLAGITLAITPPSDDAIFTAELQTTKPNVWQFLLRGGLDGVYYNIQSIASLDNGEVWEDNISVYVTDCKPTISSNAPRLLSTFGPLAISNTLYYAAIGGQSVFDLDVPDKFGHTGVLADHNVLVYEGGGRQVPYDNYSVSVGANTVTFVHPLTTGEIAVFDIVSPPPPPPVYVPPVMLNGRVVTTSLYYVALGGQSVFPLGTPDEFGMVGALTSAGSHVYRSGNRLTPVDGYALDIPNNRITLSFPAGEGEPIVIELQGVPPIPVLTSVAPKMDYLAITTANILPNLSYPPDGSMTMLFVNGAAFFSIGPTAAFTVSDRTLTWTSTMFSIPVGAAVIAVYTHV